MPSHNLRRTLHDCNDFEQRMHHDLRRDMWRESEGLEPDSARR